MILLLNHSISPVPILGRSKSFKSKWKFSALMFCSTAIDFQNYLHFLCTCYLTESSPLPSLSALCAFWVFSIFFLFSHVTFTVPVHHTLHLDALVIAFVHLVPTWLMSPISWFLTVTVYLFSFHFFRILLRFFNSWVRIWEGCRQVCELYTMTRTCDGCLISWGFYTTMFCGLDVG